MLQPECNAGSDSVPDLNHASVCSDDAQDPLPMQLLQKYIAYARQYCHPVLSVDAKQILKEHYCKLRQDSVANEGTPVTVSCAYHDFRIHANLHSRFSTNIASSVHL